MSSAPRPTRIGVQIAPQHASYDELRAIVLQLEAMGVDVVFNWDHFFPLFGDPDGLHFESWTMLASMAEALMPLVRSLLKDRGIAACIKSVQEKFDHRNLMRLGFDFAQGYAVAEPLEPIELGQKLLGTPR